LSLVEQMQHPEGRMKNSELDSDRPGQAFSRVGQGGGHPMVPVERSHERAAADFAREVAEQLRKHRNDNRFDELLLVAEPGFLGMLQSALDNVTAASVTSTVKKDLAHVKVRDLGPHLDDVLIVRSV
jgi:protein required for attachment to host cells